MEKSIVGVDNSLSMEIKLPECLEHISIIYLRSEYQYQLGIMNQQKEKTMKCPFDPSHVMPYDRFLNHLEKCQFKDKKSYIKCKYNPYHVIHKDNITKHQENCKDKAKFKVQSDEDSWGVEEEECQKPQKSTVSTSITTQLTVQRSATKQNREKIQKKNLHNTSNMMVEDFDSHDFSRDSHRQ